MLADVDERHFIPPALDPGYSEAALAMISDTKPDLLHLQNNYEVRAIARIRDRVEASGVRLYLPSTAEFSNAVSGKDQLTIQVTPQNAEPAETTFDLNRFEEGMAPLRKACP